MGIPLLDIVDLTVGYGGASLPALDGVSLTIDRGECVGVTGPSGCGKTTLALAIPGLLPAGTRTSGSICFDGRDLRRLSEPALRRIRGAAISVIFQEPALALSPVLSVGAQIGEVIRAHFPGGRDQRRSQVLEALREVGFGADAGRIYGAYPHQLSGGQRQRVLIAQAVVCRPALVIADEPTASLDSASRWEILRLIRELNAGHGIAFLLISHSAHVLAAGADRIVALSGGTISAGRLPGTPAAWPAPNVRLPEGALPPAASSAPEPVPIVQVRGVTKRYERGVLRRGQSVQALAGVDLTIQQGETLGLAGASGSGKSTLARCLAGLEQVDTGDIVVDGRSLTTPSPHRQPSSAVQLIFQDSAAALNPRFSALDIITEPLDILGIDTGRERRRLALALMDRVELPRDRAGARPAEFSGGQRQRLAIARALAVTPRLLILDESLSGLDAETRGRVLELLADLQATAGLTYLCISHDLELLAEIATDIAVMSHGRIIRRGPAPEVLAEERAAGERQQRSSPVLSAPA